MEQRDYLKKQIDQFGKVLGKIYSDLLGLKNDGQIFAVFERTNQALKNELDFDIQDILNTPTDRLLDTLIEQKKISNDNLDKLAEIFLLIADNRPGDNKGLYEKSLAIYDYLQSFEITFILDRQLKITKIKNHLIP